MTSIRQILARKPDVYSIGPDVTVFDALHLMEQKNIGALLVMSGERARRHLLGAGLRAEAWSCTAVPRATRRVQRRDDGERVRDLARHERGRVHGAHDRAARPPPAGGRGRAHRGRDLDRRRGARGDRGPALLDRAARELHPETAAEDAAQSSSPSTYHAAAQPVEEEPEDAARGERHVPLVAAPGDVPPVARGPPRARAGATAPRTPAAETNAGAPSFTSTWARRAGRKARSARRGGAAAALRRRPRRAGREAADREGAGAVRVDELRRARRDRPPSRRRAAPSSRPAARATAAPGRAARTASRARASAPRAA